MIDRLSTFQRETRNKRAFEKLSIDAEENFYLEEGQGFREIHRKTSMEKQGNADER